MDHKLLNDDDYVEIQQFLGAVNVRPVRFELSPRRVKSITGSSTPQDMSIKSWQADIEEEPDTECFLKMCDPQDSRSVSRLQREYSVLGQLNVAGMKNIFKPRDTQVLSCGFFCELTSEYLKAGSDLCTLGQLFETDLLDYSSPTSIDYLLSIAIEIVELLKNLHNHSVRHGNISPECIYCIKQPHERGQYPPKLPIMILDDFASATLFEEHTIGTVNAESVPLPVTGETHLAYIAPELTGHFNRPVDHRSDLYSLGIFLYELFTRVLPFSGDDALNIMHGHLSRYPDPPSKLNKALPKDIDRIVLKLLRKSPDDRYQSAASLLYDLNCVRDFLRAESYENARKAKDFEAGRVDAMARFEIPQGIYGREKELAALFGAYARVSQTEKSEHVSIQGYSGMGKSRLLREVQLMCGRKGSIYMLSKYNQYGQNIPFAAILSGLSHIVGDFLTLNQAGVAKWRGTLREVVGDEARVITDLIPDLEILLGPDWVTTRPPLPELGPSSSQQRFKRVLKSMLTRFGEIGRPFVIFIDDVQWASDADLQLIASLFSKVENSPMANVYLLTAFRDNEVDEKHVVNSVLLKSLTPDTRLTILPVAFEAASNFISDTLHRSRLSELRPECPEYEEIEALCSAIQRKTLGNILFIAQTLKRIYEQDGFKFDFQALKWTWVPDVVSNVAIPADVAALVISRIESLGQTKVVLKVAACLGVDFDITILAKAMAVDEDEARRRLWPGIEAGLIERASTMSSHVRRHRRITDSSGQQTSSTNEDTSAEDSFGASSNTLNVPMDVAVVGDDKENTGAERFHFFHDRAQQAAYALIPDTEKSAFHLEIGRHLQKQLTAAQMDIYLFVLCTHLNFGSQLMTESQERAQLLQYNIRAARRAYKGTAFFAGLQFIQTAVDLLPADGWQSHYCLAVDAYFALADMTFSLARYDEVRDILDELNGRIASGCNKDRLQLLARRSAVCIAMGDFPKALEALGSALTLNGYFFSTHEETRIEEEISELWKQCPATVDGVHALRELPVMEDPIILALLDVLVSTIPALWHGHPLSMTLAMLTALAIFRKHGNNAAGTACYSLLGLLMCAPTCTNYSIALGNAFGDVSEAVLQAVPDVPDAESTHVIKGCLRYWVQDWKAIRDFDVAADLAEQAYNGPYLAYACVDGALGLLFSGVPLDEVERNLSRVVDKVRVHRQDIADLWVGPTLQMMRNLSSKVNETDTDSICMLKGDAFDEDVGLPKMVNSGYMSHQFLFWTMKMLIASLIKNTNRVQEAYENCLKLKSSALGLVPHVPFVHYSTWHILDQNPMLSPEQLATVEENVKMFNDWAEHNPVSMCGRKLCLEADVLAHRGQYLSALDVYDQAIVHAKHNNHIQLVALVNERCGDMLTRRRHTKLGWGYLAEAYEYFVKWGCLPKARRLLDEHPELRLFSSPHPSIPVHLPPLTAIDATGNKGVLQKGTANHEDLFVQVNAKAPFNAVEEPSDSISPTQLDLLAYFRAALAIAKEPKLEKVIEKILRILIQVSGSDYCALVQPRDGELHVVATGDASSTAIHQDRLACTGDLVPPSVVNYVSRTQNMVFKTLEDYQETDDAYISKLLPDKCKSLMGIPLVSQGAFTGLVYLQNDHVYSAYGKQRLDLLTTIATQATFALENATLLHSIEEANKQLRERTAEIEEYAHDLEVRVQQRTEELHAKNLHLEDQIRERERAQVLMKEAKEAAEAAAAVKSRFLATMSHEIRTPFNAILGMATLLCESGLNPSQFEYAETIRTSCEELLSLLNDVLDISKIENEKLELEVRDMYLRDTIEDSVSTLALSASKKGLELCYFSQVDELVDPCTGDPTRLRQVVLNLLSNAVKFCRTGHVIVRSSAAVARTVPDGQVWKVHISVEDTGIGIAENRHDKIFSLFSQVDSSITRVYGGTGLGLAISMRLAQMMNGDITFESVPGHGSTFHFTFETHVSFNRAKRVFRFNGVAYKRSAFGILNSALLCEELELHLTAMKIPHTLTCDDSYDLMALKGKVHPVQWIFLEQGSPVLEKCAREFPEASFILIRGTAEEAPDRSLFDKMGINCSLLVRPSQRRKLYEVMGQSLQYVTAEQKGTQTAEPLSSWSRPTTPSKKLFDPEFAKTTPLRILLAEDNLVNVKVCQKMTAGLGYAIDVVYDGQQAIDKCKEKQYDMVLMDVNMPVCDGLTATRSILAYHKDQPDRQSPVICAVTADVAAGASDACIKAGCSLYLTKPLRVPALKEALLRVSERLKERRQ
ncbi:hypothetical protein SAICODRAFT_134960 [Saitoella complicata NRRL Y-17804]|uniref:histidine kinase n=1 Tax=Saitoella complicata (strain BCRC 22490 / CBS 7301 / JCM 7358 / NBRC 10748 / NRRL Y-17804) TaxID=698492 RepID=A0A0E9NCM5_SAICN|nr:uncharacterized protein SAICODRAFT_134960 [Saitoella complicata NRRL Y-17804]ODQ52402.1 hypothetical protein SAICODRAFT_134960 [Saitoella complicata NRRL Y-17804]GAO47589.1 hypothetical protein G7K_1791-t1 [Saitoella complicata NRRL Y-17804]